MKSREKFCGGSGRQDQFSHHVAALDHLVGGFRLGQVQVPVDAGSDRARGQHVDQNPHPGAPVVGPMVKVVNGEGAHGRAFIVVLAHGGQQVALRPPGQSAVVDDDAIDPINARLSANDGPPTGSITMSTPRPPVIPATRSAMLSAFRLMTCAAPTSLANSPLLALLTTPITSMPSAHARSINALPIPPAAP